MAKEEPTTIKTVAKFDRKSPAAKAARSQAKALVKQFVDSQKQQVAKQEAIAEKIEENKKRVAKEGAALSSPNS
jgi:hypothetical protein